MRLGTQKNQFFCVEICKIILKNARANKHNYKIFFLKKDHFLCRFGKLFLPKINIYNISYFQLKKYYKINKIHINLIICICKVKNELFRF